MRPFEVVIGGGTVNKGAGGVVAPPNPKAGQGLAGWLGEPTTFGLEV